MTTTTKSGSVPRAARAAFEKAAVHLVNLTADLDHLESARARAFAVLGAYWDLLIGGEAIAEFSEPVAKPNSVVQYAAEDVAAAAVGLPHELATFLLSSLYTSMLPEEVRSRYGMFFTPPPLVHRLLDLAGEAGVDWGSAKIIDPAAGGGAFLAPVASRIAKALRKKHLSSRQILDAIESRLFGAEIDPFSAWMSQVFLELAVWDHCITARRRIKPLIYVGDSLALPDGWRGGADLVVGNPPYGRTTPPSQVRSRFERSLYGHANMYGMFMDLAVRLATANGVIAFVTPTGFLGGQYFCNLRRTLRKHAPPVAVDFVSDRTGVFSGVIQETALVICRLGADRDDVAVHFNRPSTSEPVCDVAEAGTFPLPVDLQAPWVLPRSAEQVRLLRAAAALPLTLSDYHVQISTGPLVWNRHKSQLRISTEPNTRPLIWAESVLPTGEFRFSATRRNHSPYFKIEPRQRRWITHSPCILVQRTTAKEQKRRLIAAMLPGEFIADNGGVIIENHLNMVRANGRPPLVPLEAITALLNSDIADQLYRCISGSVAVSAYELAALPVPAPERMLPVQEAVMRGADRRTVEALITQAYEPT